MKSKHQGSFLLFVWGVLSLQFKLSTNIVKFHLSFILSNIQISFQNAW